MSAALTDKSIALERLLGAVADAGCGATVLFVGTVRRLSAGRDVVAIDYDAYRPLAERRLATIAAECAAEHPGARLAIVHRLGRLAVGEASVAIAVATPRREAAFGLARRALERLKREVPIWKLERYADGTATWREEEPLAAGG